LRGSAVSTEQVKLAHELLTQQFTERYLERSGMAGFAYTVPWDADEPLCDYSRTWWPARPNRFSVPVGKAILGRSHSLSSDEMDQHFVAPFVAKAGELAAALRQYPVALVNGHDIDLQAALSLLGACIGFARARARGRYQKVLEQMISLSHGVATRGTAPIAIGRPWMPTRLTFLRLQRLVVNPHLSFPVTPQMIESGIPRAFRKRYNAQLRAETIASAAAPPDPVSGLHTLWSMAPGGTPDFPGSGEHAGKLLTRSVGFATVNLMREMGCGLLPVYTRLGRGRSDTCVELGEIVPPDRVCGATLNSAMADLAEFRRMHGETNVYYQGELERSRTGLSVGSAG
jgi:hypothetical protein